VGVVLISWRSRVRARPGRDQSAARACPGGGGGPVQGEGALLAELRCAPTSDTPPLLCGTPCYTVLYSCPQMHDDTGT